RGETGVDHDLPPRAANQPDEVIKRHRPVVRIAADEVLRPLARVVHVLHRVNLVRHLRVILAAFRFPTWITNVFPFGSLRPRSETFSPSPFTPPCSITRLASEALGASPACLSSWASARPAGTVTSGMSSGNCPSRNRALNSSAAFSAAAFPWKRPAI